MKGRLTLILMLAAMGERELTEIVKKILHVCSFLV